MSTSELSGSWTYRIFNPTFVMGNLTPEEDALIRAEAVLTLRTSATTQRAVGSYSYISGNLEGEYEGGDGVLDLRGTFESGPEIFDYARFDIVGTGRPDTGTHGWEYRYYGHLLWQSAKGPDVQTPTLVGSVIRAKPHGDRKAGEVFSFIALKREQPVGPDPWSLRWILTGSWTYRSFHNNASYPYLTAPPTANGLILQEAVFKLEIPTDTTTLDGKTPVVSGSVRGGTIELPGGVLNIDLRRVRSAEVPPEFVFTGAGSGGETSGWEYNYHGHLTRNWPNEASSSGIVDQRPALVGNVDILREPLAENRADRYKHLGPVGSIYPFIAVKQPPSR
jgi:hypothetical protein